jgi:hypothetical protein
MKKICSTIAIVAFLLFCVNGIQAQTTQTKLNQSELIQQFLGTWQHNSGKDSIGVWEVNQYENAFVTYFHLVINGKKSLIYAEDWGYSSRDDNFKGYVLYPSGDYQTWIGSFTSENIFSGAFVKDFNNDLVIQKFYLKIENPTCITSVFLNKDGVITGEFKFCKVK